MKEKHKALEILQDHKRNISNMENNDLLSLNISKDLEHLKIDDDFSNEDQLYDEYTVSRDNGDNKLLGELIKLKK